MASSLDTCVVFTEPRVLSDKTAWSHFECQRPLCRLARQQHRCIVVSHLRWGRAIKEPCERWARRQHVAYDNFLADAADEEIGDATLRILCSWVTVVGCLAHDFHNAFRWSVTQYLDNIELMKSAWVATQSLRTGFDLLVTLLPRRIGRCIHFEDAADLESLARFWHMVGLSEPWAQLCVRLQIRWSEESLTIAEHLEHDAACPEQMCALFMHVWRFRTWSTSRSCGVGESCCTLLGSLFLGLEDLVSYILADEKTSKY